MSEAVLVAIITGGITLVGTALSNWLNHSKTIYRIDQLEKKVEKHNGVIERVYELEKHEAVTGETVEVMNHRIKDLEGYHK